MLQAAVVLGVGLWYRAAAMDRRANSCKMTMSRPDYVHLPVTEYPALGGNSTSEVLGYEYRLVRYMDRKLPSSEKSNPLKPGGTPVLFVPGHLGNFKQVLNSATLFSSGSCSMPYVAILLGHFFRSLPQ